MLNTVKHIQTITFDETRRTYKSIMMSFKKCDIYFTFKTSKVLQKHFAHYTI